MAVSLLRIGVVSGLAASLLLAGCSLPASRPSDRPSQGMGYHIVGEGDEEPRSALRASSAATLPELGATSTADDFIQYALLNNPAVEAAYQRWRAKAERIAQVGVLPDPRVNFGYFAEEVETRVGPQEARVGLQQNFPWPGLLGGREDAAAHASRASWRRLEATRLAVAEHVVVALYDLAYLDRTIAITQENFELLQSFEDVIRSRYRVGTGSHPELIRVQVSLGQLEDRLAQLLAMRPSYVADINAALNRASLTPIPRVPELSGQVAALEPDELASTARESNPVLLALDEEVEEQRFLEDVARKDGYPDLTVGIDYIFTGEAQNRATSGSGDDPILLNFGINVPISRGKYNAAIRESMARRLAISSQRHNETNRIASALHRAWFDHTDADRRVQLYQKSLIPKAEESLQAFLAGFRTGDTNFLDLLDTERTLLEFAISAERARADRGKALARINTLVGRVVPTRLSGTAKEKSEEDGNK